MRNFEKVVRQSDTPSGASQPNHYRSARRYDAERELEQVLSAKPTIPASDFNELHALLTQSMQWNEDLKRLGSDMTKTLQRIEKLRLDSSLEQFATLKASVAVAIVQLDRFRREHIKDISKQYFAIESEEVKGLPADDRFIELTLG